MPTRVLLAEPRGFCAGVSRAVEAVQLALDLHGPPVYVRKHVVHNLHVVADLEERGAIFVESELDVPPGARLVISAHGVEPGVFRRAAARGLTTIDTTCPLVHKVHAEVRHFASLGYTVVLVGHAGHDEVLGTTGQAPSQIVLVESVEDARALELTSTKKLAYVTQTTLSVDDTAEILDVLRERFPGIVGPNKDDICYATTNRQRAVKELLRDVDVLLVLGSQHSSNANRLVETSLAAGVPAWLVEDVRQLDAARLADYDVVGITSGASTPERLVADVCDWFRERGVADIRTVAPDARESVVFRLPRELFDGRSVTRSGSPRSDDVAVAPGRT